MAKLEKSMAVLKAEVETEKTTASLAYFQERLEELVAMGAELLIEGREAGQAQCKEMILALYKAKFPDLTPAKEVVDSSLVDTLLPCQPLGGTSK